jgi:hypothetical protein
MGRFSPLGRQMAGNLFQAFFKRFSNVLQAFFKRPK